MRVPLNLLRRRRGDEPPPGDETGSPPASGAESSPKPAPRRKFGLRYTLRALLVFITLFMLWGGYHTNRSWKERAAEQILREQGASIGSDRQWRKDNLLSPVSSAYETVVRLIWQERFITRVDLTSLDPRSIEALRELPNLESLTIEPQKYTSEERIKMHRLGYEPKAALPPGVLEQILAHHQLKALSLVGWILTDEDCIAVGKHDSLQGLSVFGSRFSERGFAELLALPRLRGLGVVLCNARGDELAAATALTSLEVVDCNGTPVNGHFAAFIAKCPQVRILSVGHDSIDDEFVANLGPHPSISTLDLIGKGFTDKALIDLAKMPALEIVTLPRSISAEAISELKSQKPGLFVIQ